MPQRRARRHKARRSKQVTAAAAIHYPIEEANNDNIIVRSVMDDEVELSESRLLDLPFHILETIMDHCVGVEYMRLRATCKRFNLAAPLIQWSNKTMSRRLHNYSVLSPWLTVVDNTNGIITFTDPLVGDKYFMKRPNVSIRNERICCSRFGWLLFASDYSPMVFLNPFTGNIHKLPYCPRYLNSVCFSAPPTSPKCMVVGFSGGGTCACVCICIHFVGRERAWDTIRLKFVGGTPNRFRFPIFSGQDIYVLCDRGELYVFKNLFKLQDYYYEKVVGARDCEGDFYLVKRSQQFLLVIVGKSGGPVRVFEPNYHTKKWERIRCLGKFMIYICGTTCLCVEAKSPEMQNKIFFPRLDFEDGKIVFYSLETCRYQKFLGKRVEEIIRVGMEVVFPHAWIVPTWS